MSAADGASARIMESPTHLRALAGEQGQPMSVGVCDNPGQGLPLGLDLGL
jgi:hypothetical protein